MKTLAQQYTPAAIEELARLATTAESEQARVAAISDVCHLTDDILARDEGREVTDEDQAIYEAVDDAERAAMEDAFAAPVVTLAHLRALTSWAARLDSYGAEVADRLLAAVAAAELLDG